MDEVKRLYIKLEKPNNEYSDGELIFESSLNKSLNFGVFSCNPLFREFNGKIYLEAKVTMSNRKKWLVENISLSIYAEDGKQKDMFEKKASKIFGFNTDQLPQLDPTMAWEALCKLTPLELPYGRVMTDREYIPTKPVEEKDFYAKQDAESRKLDIYPAGEWRDPIFEIQIDEWGRPIFRFGPDRSGYPATIECLLSDLEDFLYLYRNNPGEWMMNTILQDSPDK